MNEKLTIAITDSCKELQDAVDELAGVSDQLSIDGVKRKLEKAQEAASDAASAAAQAETSADEAEKTAEDAFSALEDLESDIGRAQEGIAEVTRIANTLLELVKPMLPVPVIEKALEFVKEHKNEILGVWKDSISGDPTISNLREGVLAAFQETVRRYNGEDFIPLSDEELEQVFNTLYNE